MKERATYGNAFHGAVDEAGVLRFDDAVGWRGRMAQLRGRRIKVTVEPEQYRRSNKANARYWSVIVPLAGHFLSRDRNVPLSKEQVHYVLASAFVGTEESPIGVPIPCETHTLTKEQFHVFTTSVEAWLCQQGYTIPELGESIEASL